MSNLPPPILFFVRAEKNWTRSKTFKLIFFSKVIRGQKFFRLKIHQLVSEADFFCKIKVLRRLITSIEAIQKLIIKALNKFSISLFWSNSNSLNFLASFCDLKNYLFGLLWNIKDFFPEVGGADPKFFSRSKSPKNFLGPNSVLEQLFAKRKSIFWPERRFRWRYSSEVPKVLVGSNPSLWHLSSSLPFV